MKRFCLALFTALLMLGTVNGNSSPPTTNSDNVITNFEFPAPTTGECIQAPFFEWQNFGFVELEVLRVSSPYVQVSMYNSPAFETHLSYQLANPLISTGSYPRLGYSMAYSWCSGNTGHVTLTV